jgi:hypothetical protein
MSRTGQTVHIRGDGTGGGGGGRNYAGYSEDESGWAAPIPHVPLAIGDVALITWMRTTDFDGEAPDSDNLIVPTEGPIEVLWESGSYLTSSYWREWGNGSEAWFGMGYFKLYEDPCQPNQTSGEYQFRLRASGWLTVDVDPGFVYRATGG